ncbi:MAG TPA: malto-oligosyltrehalose trehalohydrolase [Bryobacteraceae bacterium]|nr:malto-oligosyltrehalose trehalohydrolase [Bryobacteraceae bacterium]
MSGFCVWAPRAKSVDVVVGNRRVPMACDCRGWWSADIAEAGPGTDYLFSVNGGNPVPDPRSPWQPHGVHAASRIVDHSAFEWTARSWQPPPLSSAVIYELHIGTFTPGGTFESALGRLPHLKELGVTHVEIMPVAEFPGERGWGYDGVDLFAPHHAYGGPDGLKKLVDACHNNGLAVLLDVVYNHLGPDGNYLSLFGPYFTDQHHTPWGEAVNLDDAGSTEVRRFFCDNALMWLRDYRIDGLRLDAIHSIFDSSAVHFLEQLSREVEELQAAAGRHFCLIAESDLNDPRVVMPREANGLGFDAQWSDDFHHALHTLLTGETAGYYADFGCMEDLAAALGHIFVYGGRESVHRRRKHGKPVCGLSAHRFVVCMQNHDQVGNRAKGDRIGALAGLARQKIGAALLLCAPTVPLLFQGEEFAASTPFLYFTDHSDLGLAAAVSKGRRNEFAAFGWKPEDVPDPQDIATFQASRLRWREPEEPEHREILEWYRSLIALRRSTPALNSGNLEDIRIDFSEPGQWLVLYRGQIAIACNFSKSPHRIELRFTARALLTSGPDINVTTSTLEINPESVVILQEVRP